MYMHLIFLILLLTEVGESEELNSIICMSFKENTVKSSFLKIKLGD